LDGQLRCGIYEKDFFLSGGKDVSGFYLNLQVSNRCKVINVMKRFKYLLISSLAGFVGLASAQTEWTVLEKSCVVRPNPAASAAYGTANFSPVSVLQTLPLPESGIPDAAPFQQRQLLEETSSKSMIKPAQYLVFEVDQNQISVDSSAWEMLPAEVETAIARTPSWLHYDLRIKFRQVTESNLRSAMVSLLNTTPKRDLDEVAFQLTYLPKEVLKDSRFVGTWDWLRKNVELIYTHADSLKYVRLVEHGDTATGDWYTTTEYKIKRGGSYIWQEIDRYYYYMFIVMPKIEQEGVYVTDNIASTGQRTWGYGWREYLWSDPDSLHSYRPVNISGYKEVDANEKYDTLRVDSIPRLGEIMQMPEYLWDEQTRIWFFLRDFKSTDHALNVLGNWCSRCIPMDVTSSDDYRPSQPNQIAWKHIGNCHEDALLVAAAARTALIPLMHIGDLCDDHVWGMMHDGGDSIWHHFEFFRGGCSPKRPYYWGMTNMQPNGNYSWASSLVQGYVPDGTLLNVSDYYTKQTPACNMELTVTDVDGRAVDGARVNLYSTNYQYNPSKPYVMSAGYLWTDAHGKVYAKIGSDNLYYMKIYHPKYGSFPEESGKVYVVIKSKTVAGNNYKINYQFPGTAQRTEVASIQEKFASERGLRLNLDVRDVTAGVNPVDGQLSSFLQRTGRPASVNVYVVKEKPFSRKDSVLYRFDGLSHGSFDIPLPKGEKVYVVMANDRNLTNSVEVSYSASLVESGNFDIVPVPQFDAEKTVSLYPNPAMERLHVEAEGFRLARVFSMDGRCIKVVRTNDIPLEGLAAGFYLLQVEHRDGAVVVKKFVKE
jgi:hypothetical protein